MPYCSDCGEHVGSEVRFCPHCGAEIHGTADDTSSPDQSGGGGRSTRGGQPGGDQTRRSGQPPANQSHGGRQGGAGRGSRPDTEASSPETQRETGRAAGRDTGTARGGQQDRTGTGAPDAPTAAATDVVRGAGPTTNPEGPMPFEAGAVGHALGYPKQDDYDPILIGAIIEFLGSFLPFVNFIVRGYGFRLARASARGQVDRPDWGDYGGQFVDALKILAVSVAFGLIWVLVAGVFGGVIWVVSESAGIAVFGLVMFVASLLFPASLVTYAATDSFGAAFAPSQAGAFLTSLAYVKAYLLAAVLTPVFLLVFFISIFTIVGGFVVLAYGTYFFFSFWGYYYREAVAAESVPPAPAEPVTAD